MNKKQQTLKDARTAIIQAKATLAELRESGEIITVTEAAEMLGVSQPTASQLVKRGLLEAPLPALPGRLVTRESVETYKAHRDAKDKAGRYGEGNEPPRYEN